MKLLCKLTPLRVVFYLIFFSHYFLEEKLKPSLFFSQGRFTVQNVGPQHDGDSSKVKVKVRVNIHGLFSVANASIIERQNIEGDHNDTPMDTESSTKNQGRDDELVCKLINIYTPCNSDESQQ